MDKAAQVYKKYKSQVQVTCLIAFFLYLIISAILNFIGLFPLVIPVAVIVALIFRKRVLSLARKHIMGIMLDDLDAPFYREVIATSGIGAKNIFHTMEGEFYIGNIRGAIAIGEAVYSNSSISEKHRYSALAFLAQYYYCLGDDEGLTSACRRFRDFKLPKRGAHIRDTEKIIEKFEKFLAGDYDSFVRPINPKLKGTLYPLVTSFNEARVVLKRGELQSARTIFSSLSVAADNTVFGMLSRRAVEAIDGGTEYREAVAQIECSEIDVEATVAKYAEDTRKSKKTRMILYIVIAAILLIYLPQSIRSWLSEVDERITLRELDELYDSAQIVDMLRFKVDGKQTEFTFIADVESGLIIGARYRNSDGEWEVATYGYCPYSELDKNGSFGHAFGTHDNSALLYFEIYDHHLYYPGDDRMLHKTYHIGRGLVTVVIDDEPIK